MILAALALLSQSCLIYTDKEELESPQLESAQLMHNNVIMPVYMAIEMADFFDRYQAVREDRDAAIALGREYYGDGLYEEQLVYESYYGDGGRILLTDVPGRYIVIPRSRYTDDGDVKYYVEALGDRRYHITTKEPRTRLYIPPVQIADSEVELDCTAAVGPDGLTVIEEMDIKYEELAGKQTTTAEITSTPSSVKLQLCNKGLGNYMPFAGILKFSISGGLVNDEFSVQYSERQFNIL